MKHIELTLDSEDCLVLSNPPKELTTEQVESFCPCLEGVNRAFGVDLQMRQDDRVTASISLKRPHSSGWKKYQLSCIRGDDDPYTVCEFRKGVPYPISNLLEHAVIKGELTILEFYGVEKDKPFWLKFSKPTSERKFDK